MLFRSDERVAEVAEVRLVRKVVHDRRLDLAANLTTPPDGTARTQRRVCRHLRLLSPVTTSALPLLPLDCPSPLSPYPFHFSTPISLSLSILPFLSPFFPLTLLQPSCYFTSLCTAHVRVTGFTAEKLDISEDCSACC